MTRTTRHIACASDATYLPHVATLIESLAASNSLEGVTLHLLIDESVTSDLRGKLRIASDRHGLALDFVRPSVGMLEALPPAGRFSPLIWYRIWLPELLEPLDRVLYLDADTLVLQDLGALWDVDIGERLVAAVAQHPDMHGAGRLTGRGRRLSSSYFNSGVLLMNLGEMRADHVSERLLELGHLIEDDTVRPKRSGAQETYPDQDAYNLACEGRWLRLHPRWNCFASLFISNREYSDINELGHGGIEFAEAVASPAILHFEGSLFARPWNYRCVHPHRHLYLAYRSRTPWPLTVLEGAGMRERILNVLPPRQQLALTYLKRRLTNMSAS